MQTYQKQWADVRELSYTGTLSNRIRKFWLYFREARDTDWIGRHKLT